MLNSIFAINPIDGRYEKSTIDLQSYFSEYALIKYRVWVEIEYLIALSELKDLKSTILINEKNLIDLRKLVENFDEKNALEIKEIEKITNHDVKAVEYWLRDELCNIGLESIIEWIHFGLTSQDINNTAIPASYKDAIENCIFPILNELEEKLNTLSFDWKDITLLAKTHGQPASPTKLGKEFFVFKERLNLQLKSWKNTPITGKFGGATGNFNAHYVAFNNIQWQEFGDNFLQKFLHIERSNTTTQIEHYDNLAAGLDATKRCCIILMDLCKDIWQYVAMDYFKQKIKAGEVGSSAMPHKVNPIDFENAEGNLGLAVAICEHLASKLPISRLQRDLTDSTVLRNLGIPYAYLLIAIKSIFRGLDKLVLNETAIEKDLNANWAVVAEAIQTILRREAFPNPYDELKKLTRTNGIINEEVIRNFIEELEVSDAIKKELLAISPQNYTGMPYR